jgi:CrcB protein
MIGTIGAIAGGGALGALARHFANTGLTTLLKTPFPWGTLTVNVTGSFLIGMLIAVFASSWNPSQEIRLFLTTGFLGGFTTFSAFSADAMALWLRGDMIGAALYVTGSVVLSLAAVFLGGWIVWKFAA